MKHKIALLGFGTVGQGLCEILADKKNYLKEKYGFEYDIVAVGDMVYGNVYNPDGLDAAQMLLEAKDKKKFSKDVSKWDNLTLIKKSNATVVCEMTYTDLETGGPAVEHCRAALEAGKHVVTSNKGPAALKYPEMAQLARDKGVQFLIEGTVCSGTPILNLADGPLAGCEITAIRGILNGTTNYMLTEMEKGMAYDEVLKIAQELGYAEADPTGDVEGHDARGKVTILANVVMGASLAVSDVSCKGITGITPADIEKAKKENARWKLIGSIEKKDGKLIASVAPEMVPLAHPLAGVMGATNALTFTTDMLGDVTMVGPGAGRIETGYSILTDLIKIHR
ncbi:MAG: homoserine dehydrogenase [Candidatus Aminicenantes bacterium]|nr:homoserine dehydrogenase [Candidatus Aminicenantes bacterium]